ncbi:MAG: hypothetical protein LIO87_07605 [Eubacterium sp.]|nr:hypothetical protein [Eubacterium sp.]
MGLFKKIRKKRENIQPVHFERIYQYSTGEYLPGSSQPDCDKNYEITSGKYTPHKSVRYTDITIGGSGLPQSRARIQIKSFRNCIIKEKTAAAVQLVMQYVLLMQYV